MDKRGTAKSKLSLEPGVFVSKKGVAALENGVVALDAEVGWGGACWLGGVGQRDAPREAGGAP